MTSAVSSRDIEIIRLFLSGETLVSIGEVFGVSRQLIHKRLDNLGFTGKFRKKMFFNLADKHPSYKRELRKSDPPKSYKIYNWTKVDWSKSNIEITRQLGCCYSTVSDKRCLLAPHTKRPLQYDWKATLLDLNPKEEIFVDNYTQAKNARTAAYSIGLKIVTRKTENGVGIKLA